MKKKYLDFFKKAEESPAYWEEVFILELTEDIWKLMNEQGVSQKKLAKKLGTSEAYISKVLKGSENLSIKSIVKLAMALDAAPHIHVAPKDLVVEWEERRSYSTSTNISIQADFSVFEAFHIVNNGVSAEEVDTKKIFADFGMSTKEPSKGYQSRLH